MIRRQPDLYVSPMRHGYVTEQIENNTRQGRIFVNVPSVGRESDIVYGFLKIEMMKDDSAAEVCEESSSIFVDIND